MRISIEWQRKDGILVAALNGRVDSNNANEFQKMMEAKIDPKDKALIMDFEQISYISSAGLRVVVVMAKKFKGPYKELVICALSEPIKKLFTMTGLDQAMTIRGTRTEAIDEVIKGDALEKQPGEERVEVKEAVDYVIVGDNIEDITNFTIEKYEFTNDVVLSSEVRETATSRIKKVLWEEIERLRVHRKMLLEKMFKDAENTLNEVISGKK
ncbi:MAG: STAS domain-containing protein [Gammaproteobacteria bacterium]|nr:STAS domain-containing protein [Gammaproteobacteria bacterium]